MIWISLIGVALLYQTYRLHRKNHWGAIFMIMAALACISIGGAF